jgi:hypothetical protein
MNRSILALNEIGELSLGKILPKNFNSPQKPSLESMKTHHALILDPLINSNVLHTE